MRSVNSLASRSRIGVLAAACGLAMAVLASPAGAQSFSGGPIGIPDSGPGNPYPSLIGVSGQGYVTDVDVALNDLNHAFTEELDFLLVGPQGQSSLILSDVEGDAFDSDLTFTDQAAGPADPSVSGTYRPTNADDGSADLFPSPAPVGPFGSPLSVFNDTDADGTWRLYAYDDASGDGGSIDGWRLVIQDRSRRTVGFNGGRFREDQIATVTVRRQAGHPATVGYTTGGRRSPNETLPEATPGADYRPVSGTLQFGEGETSKNFTIPLVNDRQTEPIEAISLGFTSFTGDARATGLSYRIEVADGRPPLAKPTLSGRRVQRVLKQRGVVVYAALPIKTAFLATGTIALPRRASAVARVRLTKAATVIVPAGKRVRMKLKLTRRAAKRVKRGFRKRRRLSAKIVVRSKDVLGRKTWSRRTVKLKR